MWSFGISLHKMAVGYVPSRLKGYKYGKKSFLFVLGSGPIPFRTSDWATFDFSKLKDLIEKCLVIDPEKRITADEAIEHPWFEPSD